MNIYEFKKELLSYYKKIVTYTLYNSRFDAPDDLLKAGATIIDYVRKNKNLFLEGKIEEISKNKQFVDAIWGFIAESKEDCATYLLEYFVKKMFKPHHETVFSKEIDIIYESLDDKLREDIISSFKKQDIKKAKNIIFSYAFKKYKNLLSKELLKAYYKVESFVQFYDIMNIKSDEMNILTINNNIISIKWDTQQIPLLVSGKKAWDLLTDGLPKEYRSQIYDILKNHKLSSSTFKKYQEKLNNATNIYNHALEVLKETNNPFIKESMNDLIKGLKSNSLYLVKNACVMYYNTLEMMKRNTAKKEEKRVTPVMEVKEKFSDIKIIRPDEELASTYPNALSEKYIVVIARHGEDMVVNEFEIKKVKGKRVVLYHNKENMTIPGILRKVEIEALKRVGGELNTHHVYLD